MKQAKQQTQGNGFWNDTTGQVSAELIIVIAALLAVAAVMVGQLNNTAKNGATKLNSASNKVVDDIGAIVTPTPSVTA